MTNQKRITAFLCLALVFGGGMAKDKVKKVEKKDSLTFTVIKENPITSVKNQNRSGTCWCFSTLSFFEAELLRTQNKSYDLCESYVLYKDYLDRAQASVRMHGDVSFSQGGSFYDVLYVLKNYGICPEDAMPKPGSLYGDTLYNHNELDAVTTAYIKAITQNDKLKKISPVWQKGLAGVYDAYLGQLPSEFQYDGTSYTPKSFSESLGLKWDDYVSLTSFTHHPFYEPFIVEVQDNWRWAGSYNLPLDEFMRTMDYAIRQGYTFAWGADVSEPSFRHNDVVLMPKDSKASDTQGSDQARWIGNANNAGQAKADTKNEVEVTPEKRQLAFDNWETTDDHGMLIYGLTKDQYGKEFFMMKNSWGDYNKRHGICYVSKAYIAYKTMNIMINKNAIPADIRAKLKI